MIELVPKIPAFITARKLGSPRILPINLVFSVTYRCNSRCRTCNIWRNIGASHAPRPELSVEEYDRIFAGIGKSPFYLTFSGGEPFLRGDLVEIVASAYQHCRPKVITIPTNGLLAPRIPEQVEKILNSCPEADVIVNLSMDGVGDEHDEIRGVPGNYEKALRTLAGLRALDRDRLVIGLHTVVSQLNVRRLPEIYEHLVRLGPESVITEVAEQRIELGTVEAEITPNADDYDRAALFLIAKTKERQAKGFAAVTRAFRLQYYGLAARTIRERRQIIPCYAGIASGHVAPDGDVWTCCTRAEPLGNLRDHHYQFRQVWESQQANALRRRIKNRECYCPMANASYTNMLLDPESLFRVCRTVLLG